MIKKRIVSVVFYILLSIVICTITSCSSHKASCDAHQTKSSIMKKNKSGYGARYSYKGKPARKAYVIRNGR